MITKQYYLIVAALCMASCNFVQALHIAVQKKDSKRAAPTSILALEQASKIEQDTQEARELPQHDVDLFFAVVLLWQSDSPAIAKLKRALAWELIHIYGADIINMPNPTSGEPTLATIVTEQNWSAEEFEELIQIPGVDLNKKGDKIIYQLTPLEYAMRRGQCYWGEPKPNSLQLKKLELLIRYGATINYTPLIEAARRNRPAVLSLLLRGGACQEVGVDPSQESKTLFDLVKEHPEVQEAFDDYKHDITTLVTEQLSGIADLGTIVGEYLLGSEKQKDSADTVMCELKND